MKNQSMKGFIDKVEKLVLIPSHAVLKAVLKNFYPSNSILSFLSLAFRCDCVFFSSIERRQKLLL